MMCGLTSWNYGNSIVEEYDDEFITHLKNTYNVIPIFGHWDTEEQMRNDALVRATDDGFDIMFIQDADEFIYSGSYVELKGHDGYDVGFVPWVTHWKKWGNVLINSSGNVDVGYPQFLVNLNSGVRFRDKRNLQSGFLEKRIDLKYKIQHGSYVLTDRQVKEKISNWGHSNDFDTERWYNDVWMNETSENLHPVNPSAWKTYRYMGDDSLPLELLNWDYSRME